MLCNCLFSISLLLIFSVWVFKFWEVFSRKPFCCGNFTVSLSIILSKKMLNLFSYSKVRAVRLGFSLCFIEFWLLSLSLYIIYLYKLYNSTKKLPKLLRVKYVRPKLLLSLIIIKNKNKNKNCAPYISICCLVTLL